MSKKIPKNKTNVCSEPVIGDFVSSRKSLFLYRFVYGNTVSFALVVLLMCSFLLQGVEKVYADELPLEQSADTTEEQEISSQIDDSVLSENVSDVAAEEESVSQLIVEDISPSAPAEELAESADESSEEVVPDEEVDSEESESLDTDIQEGDVSTEEGSISEAEESDSASSTSTESDPEEIPLDENVTFEAVSITQSDSEFSFNKDECTQLATGSFYCHQPQENILDDALFAAPDADGDLEIFLVRAGVQTQVTSNTMDDASPYFDQNTNTLVWHRLIDDRYQVISFDVEEGRETQLTRTSENNMEPTRQGDYTVWQRWVDGGWNIILFDGEDETQLTKTTSHNIAPYIHGSLVVWNRYTSANDKTIEMYDIQNETYVSVDDPDGMSVSNPRMVFVYDSLHPNGDIVTKGYDVLARKFIDLDTLPRDLPEELPSSDSTGETRALIQSKPSLKSDAEESLEGMGSSTPNILPSIATSTESMTLDLTQVIEPVSVPTDSHVSSIPPEDLHIPAYFDIDTVTPVQE